VGRKTVVVVVAVAVAVVVVYLHYVYIFPEDGYVVLAVFWKDLKSDTSAISPSVIHLH